MRGLLLLAFMSGVILGHGTGVFAQGSPADSADGTATRLVRVRSEYPEIADTIRRASDESATFRRLMAAIDRTDGLIYVDKARCGHGVHSCLVLSVQAAGPFRILHIRVEPQVPDCHLMATIGHELQHAIEVLSYAYVTTGAQAYLLYDRLAGLTSLQYHGRFETEEAIHAGLDVDLEACKSKGR
jgi:hypothetical protein